MKYVVLLLLFGFVCWGIYGRIKRKLRALRGEPEPEHKAPHSVKLLAAGIVVVYGMWIAFRLYGNA